MTVCFQFFNQEAVLLLDKTKNEIKLTRNIFLWQFTLELSRRVAKSFDSFLFKRSLRQLKANSAAKNLSELFVDCLK